MDETEIHFSEKSGRLTLDCAETAFRRIREAVVSELNLPEATTERIHEIEVFGPESMIPRGIGDRICLVGCAIVSFLLAGVFVIGLAATYRMLFHR